MWELDYKEDSALKNWCFQKKKEKKNWCFQTVLLEKTLESPLGCKEIKPVNPKGNQPWIFIGRNDADWSWNCNTSATWCEEPTLGKDPDAEKDWGQEKGLTEDEMVGWHHWLNGHWANSGRWWRTGRSDVLQSMGSQRLRHKLATEQQQQY